LQAVAQACIVVANGCMDLQPLTKPVAIDVLG